MEEKCQCLLHTGKLLPPALNGSGVVGALRGGGGRHAVGVGEGAGAAE